MDKPKILLVDDELSVIKAIQRLLIAEDYEIDYTTDPKNALAKINTISYDVVISDQRMPEMSGLSLLIHCKRISPDTVRILMTGYEDLDVIVSAINDGSIYYYFSKPWKNENFIQTVKSGIQYKREQDEKRLILESVLDEKEGWLKTITKIDTDKIGIAEKIEKHVTNNKISEVAKLLLQIIYVRDKELYEHGLRVSQYAVRLAERLNVSAEQRSNIKYAALLHDIGKIAIKDRIMYKPASLDSNEYEEMKKHSQMGADILNQLDYMKPIAKIVEEHHERIDGSGYPRSKEGSEISLASKMIAICDTFDALTNDRVYRTSLSQEEALDVICKDGCSLFDSQVVREFVEMIQLEVGVTT